MKEVSENMNKKNITLIYGLSQFTYWAGYVTLMSFASFYLLGMGVSNTNVGLVIAIGSVISALLQPVLGGLSDRYEKLSSRNILVLLALIEMGCIAALLLIGKGPLPVVCTIYGLAILILQMNQPFLNTLAVVCENAGCTLTFGIARSMGSFGYASLAYVMGILSSRYGIFVIPAGVIIALVLLLLTTFFYPRLSGISKEEKKHAEEIKTLAAEDSEPFFRRYPGFLAFIIGLTLIYYSHNVLNTFTLQIITEKGGTSAEMGTATAIAAVVEMILFVFSGKLMKRFSLAGLIRFSFVFFMIKNLASYLVTTVKGFYMAQLLQIFAWGILAVVVIYYIKDIMAEDDLAKGQAYATATLTYGNVGAALVGGRLIDMFGVQSMVLSGVIAAVIAIAVVFYATEKLGKNNN